MPGKFEKALKGHDWYYQYSDDQSVWRRGRDQWKKICRIQTELNCPFEISDLSKWVYEMIVDLFDEEEPGKWFRRPHKYECEAPRVRDDLFTREEFNKITAWLKRNDQAEEPKEGVHD